jgi:hypothetical protein
MFGSSSNRYVKYLKTFKLLAFAVSTMLYIIPLEVAPFEDLENNQFFLPITKLLIALSA